MKTYRVAYDMIVDYHNQPGVIANGFNLVVVARNVEEAIKKVRTRVVGKTDYDKASSQRRGLFTCTNIIVQEAVPIVSIDIIS